MQAFIGTICVFGFNFAPRDFQYCNGQLISIQQNSALFSLLGTYYGGNGTTNFALPNLQNRNSVHMGQLTGGSLYTIGEVTGTDSVTLLPSNLPPHAHTVTMQMKSYNGGRTAANSNTPVGTFPALNAKNPYNTASSGNPMQQATVTLGTTGGTVPIAITDPTLVMNYCICMYGIYPSRN